MCSPTSHTRIAHDGRLHTAKRPPHRGQWAHITPTVVRGWTHGAIWVFRLAGSPNSGMCCKPLPQEPHEIDGGGAKEKVSELFERQGRHRYGWKRLDQSGIKTRIDSTGAIVNRVFAAHSRPMTTGSAAIGYAESNMNQDRCFRKIMATIDAAHRRTWVNTSNDRFGVLMPSLGMCR